MNVLVLTQTLDRSSGWGQVSYCLIEALKKIDGRIRLDVYTGESRKTFSGGKDALKSGLAPRLCYLPCLFDVINILCRAQKRYDLIHALTEQYAVLGMLLSKLFGIPYIITAHGTYAVLLPSKHKTFKKAFAKANMVMANSNYTRNRMLEEGIDAAIEVVTLGVDKGRFCYDRRVEKTNTITFVGNTKTRKGLSFLMEAFRNAKKVNKKTKLRIIGDVDTASEEYLNAENYTKENNLNVEFLGKVSESELVKYYQEAKLNVLPSKSERFFFEGFGLIHLEANACGTLTVGTYESGNEDAIMNGCGYLVKYGDVDKLSQIITNVIQMEGYPNLNIDSLPSWENVAEKYKVFYEKITG